MTEDAAPHPGLTLDNYADLLAAAGISRATASCSYCPPDTPPVPANALYLLHDLSGDTTNVGLMCPEHAGDWCRTGVVGVGTPLTAPGR